jgi:hypothetical protein
MADWLALYGNGTGCSGESIGVLLREDDRSFVLLRGH